MGLVFSKMHGLGNDFMVINALENPLQATPAQIARWADRHRGIGFDQLLVVEKPSSSDVLFNYRIFNADGSEVEQCGNGARCFARYVLDKGLTAQRQIPVMTKSGRIVLFVEDDGQVRVNMGKPIFKPSQIPLDRPKTLPRYTIALANETIEFGAVSMGNPHMVIPVANIHAAEVERLGPLLETHKAFPQKVNVGFMQWLDSHAINLRVYERGVGETQACGTGACAAAAVAIHWQQCQSPVVVHLPGGNLTIHWSGQSQDDLWMTGPIAWVFDGVLLDV